MSITQKTAKLLHDARSAALEVLEYCSGRTREDLYNDRSLQIIVTHLVAMIGESLRQAERTDPDLSDHIQSLRDIIGTRNRVIHGYNDINYSLLWDMTEIYIPELIEAIDGIIGKDETQNGLGESEDEDQERPDRQE
jgi:uncharacterized protein with HEPN domain